MSTTDFKPIKATAYDCDPDPGTYKLDEHDRDKITALLMGRKVEKVDGEHLLLDDGTLVKAIGHDGGCACSAGCYDLSVLNGVDNVITRVEYDYRPDSDDGTPSFDGHPDDPEGDWLGYYRVFVYAENQQINLMQFNGSDGNGYYGTGFEIVVRPAATEESR